MWFKVAPSVELGYTGHYPFTISIVDGKVELAKGGLIYCPVSAEFREDGVTMYHYGRSAPVRKLLLVKRGQSWWVAIPPAPPDDDV